MRSQAAIAATWIHNLLLRTDEFFSRQACEKLTPFNKLETQHVQRMPVSMKAIAVCLSMFVAAPAAAQPRTDAVEQDGTSQHHQRIYQLMKDMSQEMSKMTEQMSGSDIKPETREQMSKRMELMSTMMRRMSGLAARPAMSDPESQKQMEEMRVQMDDMMHDARMRP